MGIIFHYFDKKLWNLRSPVGITVERLNFGTTWRFNLKDRHSSLGFNKPAWFQQAQIVITSSIRSQICPKMWNATILACKIEFPNSTTEQELCFLQKAMGHQEMPKMKLFGTIVYAIIFCTGVFGNICTCAVITKHRLLRTSTNTYLVNLAIADLVTLLVGLPLEVYMVWHPYPWIFPDFFCYFKGNFRFIYLALNLF